MSSSCGSKCRECNKPLNSEVSRSKGLGPDCAKRIGIPYFPQEMKLHSLQVKEGEKHQVSSWLRQEVEGLKDVLSETREDLESALIEEFGREILNETDLVPYLFESKPEEYKRFFVSFRRNELIADGTGLETETAEEYSRVYFDRSEDGKKFLGDLSQEITNPEHDSFKVMSFSALSKSKDCYRDLLKTESNPDVSPEEVTALYKELRGHTNNWLQSKIAKQAKDKHPQLSNRQAFTMAKKIMVEDFHGLGEIGDDIVPADDGSIDLVYSVAVAGEYVDVAIKHFETPGHKQNAPILQFPTLDKGSLSQIVQGVNKKAPIQTVPDDVRLVHRGNGVKVYADEFDTYYVKSGEVYYKSS